ncbi:glucose 1-dehydrogenase [Phenylobacterium montanum]|uniref:D-xylose 1-dehydrogenase n=1 Tax=Phenylobacterium montanum TaxID=2823693 RepID=A0A975IX27_9CAUL|nr:glucose 1-dehydrogenase [Caulobacter sp. S6]QUD90513.1 glucose 1-dehydrogenase [Caulobacter sp. S6]
MSGRLSGKVALVTGAASGIGADCARLLAREGARVVVTDVQAEKGGAVAAEVGGDFALHDVADEAQWTSVIGGIVERHGRLDVLINNAGVFVPQTIEDCELETWNKVLSVNLTGVMLGCKHAVRAMKSNPGGPKGSIVNVSSITGFIGLASAAAYTASKGGVRLLTKSVAVHCARSYRDIRCNSLHPGAIDTPMNQAAFDASGDPEGTRAFFSSVQPIGRMASSLEMANCALFLASDEASFVTGTELVADGGWLAASGPL